MRKSIRAPLPPERITMDFLREHQLSLMLIMSGMCGILAVMTLIAKALPRKTKQVLASMELSAMMLLLFDREAYIFRGDVSRLGYYMVRVSNGMVFFLSLLITFLVTRFLSVIYLNECKLERLPKQLIFADGLFCVGAVLLLVSQFTGLYYTFDENNNYQRSPLYSLCLVIPLLMVILQEWSLINNRKRMTKGVAVSVMICIAMPTVASVLQIFTYGISLTNLTVAFVVIVFYTYSLVYLGNAAERAKQHELEYYKRAKEKEAALFEQTTEALANAIDAKDKYTRGHSSRVAAYSKRIAKAAGLPDKYCDQVYFAALLHDVGKIGVSHSILNKTEALTDEEYEQIKAHSILGDQILSTIKQAPFLATGARHHHERFDGSGYPDGLSGVDIPKIARIIAVADAYDAMTSHRSYREPLDREAVRKEFESGMGTQFDPGFAEIMLCLMDDDEKQNDAAESDAE